MKYVHPALTHGDLAGDNIMLKQDGALTFVDWGETRISSPLTDLACLLSYRIGSEDRTQEFLNIYFNSPEALEKNLPCLQVLIRLYRYRSCVQSLLWLNEEGETGLDVIGRAHFEKVRAAL